MNERLRARVLRVAAANLARELGRTPEAVHADLEEAIAAGLLDVTHTGLKAKLPPESKR